MTAVFAHRGDTREAPENTLEAFRAALANGADGVELDVRLTRDKVVVVHHDPVVAGRGPVHELAYEELAGEVPTLAAALGVCREGLVNVEVKSPPVGAGPGAPGELARAVAGLVAPAAAEGRVVVSSFSTEILDAVREAAPGVPVGWLRGLVDPLGPAVEEAAERGYQAVHPFVSQVDEAGVNAAHRGGLAVAVWTVNAPGDLEKMARLGVEAVVTDQLGLALAVIRGRSGSGGGGGGGANGLAEPVPLREQ